MGHFTSIPSDIPATLFAYYTESEVQIDIQTARYCCTTYQQSLRTNPNALMYGVSTLPQNQIRRIRRYAYQNEKWGLFSTQNTYQCTGDALDNVMNGIDPAAHPFIRP